MTDLIPHSCVYSRRIKSPSSVRIAYGEMAEILVCERYRAERLTTNGAPGSVCPDVRLPCGTLAEVKSSRDGKIVVYHFRLQKELEQMGTEYPYFIVLHRQRVLNIGNFFATAEVIRCTLGEVNRAAATEERRYFRSSRQSGYNRNGYQDGYYNIHVDKIRKPATL